MKNKFLSFVAIFFAIILLTGCNNENNSIKSIEDTKIEVESIVDKIVKNNNNGFANPISQTFFHDSFLSFTYDLFIELEQKYNSGDKIFLKFDNEEINGKIIGEDKNDKNKYYVYIGNSDYEDVWSYGTIDLATGNISWENGY